MKNANEQIYELEREIAGLPQGSITKKKVRNGVYFYHRINVNGKRREIYADSETAAELSLQIEHRKKLEAELKKLKANLSDSGIKANKKRTASLSFHTYIRIGETLHNYVEQVKDYEKRDCFRELRNYLYDEQSEKVLILFGLRRTGKTTLIRQLIADMSSETFSKTVFMQVKSSDTLADVNEDIKKLESKGYRYVFIDEVTLLKDFIEGAALFSDIFAASGIKIVLSGTDSLGFLFSEDEQLFDRCHMIHTTFIPYREFERITGVTGIDNYIQYGGTLSPGGVNYNENSVFSDAKRAGEYIDSAIAKNIQHSLKCYQSGDHFRNLRELYDNSELTSAINRVVEDMNHKFAVETLTRTFVSNDLALSASNLRRDRNHPDDILDHIDIVQVTDKLKKALEILDKEEQDISVSERHVAEIREYLMLLDMIREIEIRHIPDSGIISAMNVITQPGMRYVQASELIQCLLSDKLFSELDITDKSIVIERILNEIKGRMMEEAVLLETQEANPRLKVFKLQFAIGEFDMVVFDPRVLSCRIYEIKHSYVAVPEQCRHLNDSQKCAQTEHQFGRIAGKYVIYNGPSFLENDIEYINVEEYLRGLRNKITITQ